MTMSLASKVMRDAEFGCAAGCEAVALPRRELVDFCPGLCPSYGLWPKNIAGKARTKGAARKQISPDWAGQSLRFTSGGEASLGTENTFEARP
jgi:hypothetical protein